MKNYQEQLTKQWWQELSPQIDFKTVTQNFDVDFIVALNEKYVHSILIYSHTTGTFENQKDADRYIGIFCEVIQEIHQIFPELKLYYIQNYEGFDPSKYIEYIKHQTQTQPELIKTLKILPFKNQARVAKKTPKIITETMPDIRFSKSIEAAIETLDMK